VCSYADLSLGTYSATRIRLNLPAYRHHSYADLSLRFPNDAARRTLLQLAPAPGLSAADSEGARCVAALRGAAEALEALSRGAGRGGAGGAEGGGEELALRCLEGVLSEAVRARGGIVLHADHQAQQAAGAGPPAGGGDEEDEEEAKVLQALRARQQLRRRAEVPCVRAHSAQKPHSQHSSGRRHTRALATPANQVEVRLHEKLCERDCERDCEL
jgi:hypothetical protein